MSRPLISSLNLASRDLSNRDYHADKTHLGASTLKALDREGPEYAAAYHAGELHSDSDSMAIGSAVHAIIDGTFADCYEVAPDENGYKTRGTQKFSAMSHEIQAASGRELLTHAEAREADRCGQVLRRFFSSRYVGHAYWREPSLFWSHHTEDGRQVACKCRPDRLIDDGTGGAIYAEIKTARSCGDKAVRAAFWQFGYWIQQAHYAAGILANGANRVRTVFVFVRNAPPYDLRVFELSTEDAENATYQWRRLMADWSRRVEQNDWTDADMLKPRQISLGIRGDETQLEGFDDE